VGATFRLCFQSNARVSSLLYTSRPFHLRLNSRPDRWSGERRGASGVAEPGLPGGYLRGLVCTRCPLFGYDFVPVNPVHPVEPNKMSTRPESTPATPHSRLPDSRPFAFIRGRRLTCEAPCSATHAQPPTPTLCALASWRPCVESRLPAPPGLSAHLRRRLTRGPYPLRLSLSAPLQESELVEDCVALLPPRAHRAVR